MCTYSTSTNVLAQCLPVIHVHILYNCIVVGNIRNFDIKNLLQYTVTKYRLTTCSTIGHTHKRFVGIKQCLKHHQQLVQTTTILHVHVHVHVSVKHTFLAYWSIRSTKTLSYQLTHTTTITLICY